MQRHPPWAGLLSRSSVTHQRAGLRRFARILGVTVAALLLLAACGAGNPAALRDIQGTSRQQLIAARNDPAVMLIITEYTATISVPTLGVNDAAVQALLDRIQAEAQAGQIGNNVKAMDDAEVAAIGQNPNAYFTSNQPVVTKDVTLDFGGTGSIVTPDGYIVTAAHVTKMPQEELDQGYVDQGLKPMLDAAVKDFQADNTGSGFDTDQLQKLSDAVTAYLADQAQRSNQSESIVGALFSSTSGGERQAAAKPLSLVTQGNAPTSSEGPFGDKDVSILKLDGYTNLPTVSVGSDSNVDAGQQLFVVGYPGAADESTLENLGTPTLTAGAVSAKKTSQQGVPLLETTATISGGNSGGPGFDQNGNLVGIVSYGSSSNGASYNYLIGASVVNEFLHEKNIQSRQSQTTTLYDTALNDYYQHYYKRALPEFQQVKALDPSHPYVDTFIQKTQTAISQGADQTPLLDTTALLILVGGVAALVVVAGGGTTFFILRRRSRAAYITQFKSGGEVE